MSTRTCVIDANACGAGLSVDDSMLQITTIAGALSSARSVHGDVSAMSGEFAFELYVWTVSRVALGTRVSIGIAKPTDTLDHEIGSSADSYGYRIGDGTVRNNSSTLVTVQTAAERTCIGVRVSLAPGAASVSWYVAGTLVHTQSLPTGQAWVPAVTISGGDAGDINAWLNFGQHRWDCFAGDVRGTAKSEAASFRVSGGSLGGGSAAIPAIRSGYGNSVDRERIGVHGNGATTSTVTAALSVPFRGVIPHLWSPLHSSLAGVGDTYTLMDGASQFVLLRATTTAGVLLRITNDEITTFPTS